MRSLIAAVFVLFSQLTSTQVPSKAAVQIKVLPERPLIEHRGATRMLNFDFLLQNSGSRSVSQISCENGSRATSAKLEMKNFLGWQ